MITLHQRRVIGQLEWWIEARNIDPVLLINNLYRRVGELYLLPSFLQIDALRVSEGFRVDLERGKRSDDGWVIQVMANTLYVCTTDTQISFRAIGSPLFSIMERKRNVLITQFDIGTSRNTYIDPTVATALSQS